MATSKRLIRFASGPMTGQFRYITPHQGCMQAVKGVANPNWAEFKIKWNEEHKDKLPGVTGTTEASFSDCAERHQMSDKEYQAYIEAVKNSNLQREMKANFWSAVVMIAVEVAPGIVPIITPPPRDTLPPLPTPVPPTPSPKP